MTADQTFILLNQAFGTAAPLIFFSFTIIVILWRYVQKKDERLEKMMKDSIDAHRGVSEALVKISERLNNFN